jgi:hypothetical protein
LTASASIVARDSLAEGFLALAGVKKPCSSVAAALLDSLAVVICCGMMHGMEAQAADRTMLDPNLAVRTVVAGVNQPTTMAFLGPTDILVLEKATGKVQHVVNGVIQSTVLDLAVNSAPKARLLRSNAIRDSWRSPPEGARSWSCASSRALPTVLAMGRLRGARPSTRKGAKAARLHHAYRRLYRMAARRARSSRTSPF